MIPKAKAKAEPIEMDDAQLQNAPNTDWVKFDDAESGHFFLASSYFHQGFTKNHPLSWPVLAPSKPKGKAKVQVCNRIFSRLFYSLDGGFIFLIIFTPIPGEMIQVDEHIFQKGWFNHQLLFDFWTYLG